MDRGVEEEQETSNLLHFDDEQKESTTLTEAAAALKDAKAGDARGLPERGPASAARYVDDPACSDA